MNFIETEESGYEEFVPSKKDFLFKDNLNVNMNNLSLEKSATGHDYDNVSIGKSKLDKLCKEILATAKLLEENFVVTKGVIEMSKSVRVRGYGV